MRQESKRGRIELIFDEGYFEIFADDGLIPFSIMTYVQQEFEKVSLHKILQ